MAYLEQNDSSGDTTNETGSFSFCSPLEMQISKEVCADTLCLSRRRLKHIEYSILKISAIKHLYLEGNEISILPGTLFSSLPNLMWLDLRNNQITQLPLEIGQHRVLKTLLLEGNPITELPLELGNLVTLTALSLRQCPITFPPQDVLFKGVQCILQFLRRAMAERLASERNTVAVLSEVVPPIENLHLSSLDCSEDMSDPEDQQVFEDLKLRMKQMERVESGHGAPAHSSLSNSRLAQGEGGPRGHALPNTRRKMELAKGTFPDVLLCDEQHWKRSEEGKRAAMRNMNQKQELLQQRRKDDMLLRKWRLETRIRQERGVPESGRRNPEEVLKKAPYATDPPYKIEENLECLTHNALHKEPRKESLTSLKELEEMRGTSDRDLEERIRTHVQMMQERSSGPVQEEEVEEAKMLQQCVAEQREDYRLAASTAEESP